MRFDPDTDIPCTITEDVVADVLQDKSERLEWGKQAGELLLRMTGEKLSRPGLKETPERMAKAFDFLLSGYQLTPSEAVGQGIFPAEGQGLVAVRRVEFFSMCEHHMLPFWGHASVSYYPSDRILGLSKIPRLINLYARRVQVQERLTHQIRDAVVQLIQPRAVFVQIEAAHMCMMMRGVEKVASHTYTEAFHGLDQLSDFEKQQILKTTV